MSEPLFPTAAPDFSDPLGLLRACHARILGQCDMLIRLAQHLRTAGPDDEARAAARRISHYFTTAGRHHHEDEESDLFPRVTRQSLKLADLVHRLRQEHRTLDALWEELGPLLARPNEIKDLDSFETLANRFAEAQRSHVERENSELLEIAQHIFGRDELKTIGISMAERRGLTPTYL